MKALIMLLLLFIPSNVYAEEIKCLVEARKFSQVRVLFIKNELKNNVEIRFEEIYMENLKPFQVKSFEAKDKTPATIDSFNVFNSEVFIAYFSGNYGSVRATIKKMKSIFLIYNNRFPADHIKMVCNTGTQTKEE